MVSNQKGLKNKLEKIIKASHLNQFFDSNKLAKLIKTRSSYRRCSIEKVFLKIMQIHTKKSVLQAQALACNFVKKKLWTSVFIWTPSLQSTFGRVLLKNWLFNMSNNLFLTGVSSPIQHIKNTACGISFLSQVCKVNLQCSVTSKQRINLELRI